MSTAGKVLTILILLVMICWLVLVSAVTQNNVNWQLKIAAQKKTLEQTTIDLTKANSDYLQLTESGRMEQDATDRDLRVILAEIAATEGRLSTRSETLLSLKLQVAEQQANAMKAEENLTNRKAEKVKTEENLAKMRDQTAKAQAENADYREQLAKLQDEFKRLLAENSARVKKEKEANASKPVSDRRPSPSS